MSKMKETLSTYEEQGYLKPSISERLLLTKSKQHKFSTLQKPYNCVPSWQAFGMGDPKLVKYRKNDLQIRIEKIYEEMTKEN